MYVAFKVHSGGQNPSPGTPSALTGGPLLRHVLPQSCHGLHLGGCEGTHQCFRFFLIPPS